MPTPRTKWPSRRLGPLLVAYTISQFGNWMFRAGLVYHLYNQQQGSAPLLTGAVLLVYLPILIGSRALAPRADRAENRRTLILLDLVRATLLAALLPFTLSDASATTAVVLTVLAVLSMLSPFFTASQTSYLRRVLPTDQVQRGLVALSNVEWATYILGTAAGPVVVGYSSLSEVIMLDLGTFVISLLLLTRAAKAPIPTTEGATPATPTAGTPYNPIPVLVSVFFLNAGAGLINVYPNVATRDFLHLGPNALTVFFLMNGLGGLIGATLAGRLPLRRRPWLVVGAAVAVAGSLGLMHELQNAVAAIAASSAMLLAGQVFAVGVQSQLLATQPVGRAGTVSGWFTLATFGGVTASTLLFAASTLLGPATTAVPPLMMLAAGSAAVSAFILAIATCRTAQADPSDLLSAVACSHQHRVWTQTRLGAPSRAVVAPGRPAHRPPTGSNTQ